MVPSSSRNDEREHNRRNLYTSLCIATQVIEDVANGLYTDYQSQRPQRNTYRGHNFHRLAPAAPQPAQQLVQSSGYSLINYARSWLTSHEDTQVMLASVLVVVGIWWLVRTVFALFINLVGPLLVVIFAVALLYGLGLGKKAYSTRDGLCAPTTRAIARAELSGSCKSYTDNSAEDS